MPQWEVVLQNAVVQRGRAIVTGAGSWRILLGVLSAMIACRNDGDCIFLLGEHTASGFQQPCHPNDYDGQPEDAACCSDDPATVGGLDPRYPLLDMRGPGTATPLFSDVNNEWAEFGTCVHNVELPRVDPAGCSTPCNPRWDAETVAAICGFGLCVQHQAVSVDDCIEVDGVRRPVRGSDMVDPEDWIVERSGTRQDPELKRCRAYAAEGATPAERDARLRQCVDALTVADQRGFCIATTETLPVPDPCSD